MCTLYTVVKLVQKKNWWRTIANEKISFDIFLQQIKQLRQNPIRLLQTSLRVYIYSSFHEKDQICLATLGKMPEKSDLTAKRSHYSFMEVQFSSYF